MKTSIAIPSLDSFLSLDALDSALRRIAGLGYTAVEPLIGVPDHDRLREKAKEYLAVLERHGLRVSGFRTGLIYRELGFGFSSADPGERDAAVKAVCDVIEFTGCFQGAKVLNGLIQGPPPGNSTIEETKVRVYECLKLCAAYAEKYHCSFCVEPLNRYELPYHNTVAEVGELLSKIGSPALGVLIDTFHMNIEEADVAGAVLRSFSSIQAVHFMDSNRLPPGYGHLPMRDLFRALNDRGYEEIGRASCRERV
jgi:sugar phosphate isomerase/epimerase